ncbi:AmmeMemoRadiSam system protein B [Litoribacillus peritrichatus]|uniref:MEMO1 family protein GCM10022277_28140 n=1 Tax=Litoribacillus peritrichatus TaxID=718191 RepID=A0ABP7MTG0_9GAMM
MNIRYPAVAGSFYPESAEELRQTLNQLLTKAPKNSCHPKALIAPHAGYIYSGPIAATAYNTLADMADKIHRVVLLGPAHRVPLRGIAMPDTDVFRTPLGDITVDQKALDQIQMLDCITTSGQAHAWEHSLEVHLPFLQQTLKDFELVPLVVGETEPEVVANVIETLWGGEETLIVVSTDLSHYLKYQDAQKQDYTTTEAIEHLTCHIDGQQACGCNPLNGLLLATQHHHLKLTTLDLRNSGDTAGPKDHVVGYGAYAIH